MIRIDCMDWDWGLTDGRAMGGRDGRQEVLGQRCREKGLVEV